MPDSQQTAAVSGTDLRESTMATTSLAPARRRLGPVPVTLALAVLFGGGYVAYQRVGTTANADAIEYTRNLADGFVAVGFTKKQPGFVVLSAVNQPLVDIATDLISNRLAGTHTIVRIKTNKAQWQKRLRGPVLIVIDKEGRIDASAIDWSLSDFAAIRKGIDCDQGGASKRCGDPFADLYEFFAAWDKQRVPEQARRFLTPFADHRELDLKKYSHRPTDSQQSSRGLQPARRSERRMYVCVLETAARAEARGSSLRHHS